MSMCRRGTGYSNLHAIGGAFDLVAGVLRQVERIRSFVFKDTESLTELSHRLSIELGSAYARHHNHSGFPSICRATKRLPSGQLVHRKRDVLPASRLRRNIHRTKNSIGLISLWFDKQTHTRSSLNWVTEPGAHKGHYTCPPDRMLHLCLSLAPTRGAATFLPHKPNWTDY